MPPRVSPSKGDPATASYTAASSSDPPLRYVTSARTSSISPGQERATGEPGWGGPVLSVPSPDPASSLFPTTLTTPCRSRARRVFSEYCRSSRRRDRTNARSISPLNRGVSKQIMGHAAFAGAQGVSACPRFPRRKNDIAGATSPRVNGSASSLTVADLLKEPVTAFLVYVFLVVVVARLSHQWTWNSGRHALHRSPLLLIDAAPSPQTSAARATKGENSPRSRSLHLRMQRSLTRRGSASISSAPGDSKGACV